MSNTEQKPDQIVEAPKKNHNKYRKEKAWDTDDIEHWKIEEFKKEHSSGPFLEESSFATLFPRYRETYLREIWPHLTEILDSHGINCVLDLKEGSMTVKTTRKTFDPYIILKARDLIKLLSRSVPLPQAAKILEDDKACDIVKIGNIVRNKERFVKRRQRLIGPNGNTLKALELLTKCYMLVQGNTVAIMGSFNGIKTLRRIILDCMNNIHPIYHIKELMIRRELAADEKLKHEVWDRFLPKFHKKSAPKQKKPKTKKKEYTPFPPEQLPRKVDLQMESGEYFLKPEEKALREAEKKKQLQKENSAKKQEKRLEAFVAPDESKETKKSKKRNSEPDNNDDIAKLKEKITKKAKKDGTLLAKAKKALEPDSVDNYISKNAK